MSRALLSAQILTAWLAGMETMNEHVDEYEVPTLSDYGTIEEWTQGRSQIGISIIIDI